MTNNLRQGAAATAKGLTLGGASIIFSLTGVSDGREFDFAAQAANPCGSLMLTDTSIRLLLLGER